MLQRRINTARIAEIAGGRAHSDGAGNHLAGCDRAPARFYSPSVDALTFTMLRSG
jgi:hypothetical protein